MRSLGFEPSLVGSATPRYFEDFSVGETLVTPTWEATEAEIVWFAERYDPQYYHLDRIRAEDSLFKGLVSGGFQTAALVWGLALRTGIFEGTAVAGIGVDEMRWLRPLRLGDIVHVEFQLIEGRPSRSKPGLATMTFQYVMKNQRNEDVISMRMIQMLKCRPPKGQD
jgi:acyl dehydratase